MFLDTSSISLVAVTGESVSLPCNISMSKLRDVDLVLWYLGPSGKPIFTLDARAHSAIASGSLGHGSPVVGWRGVADRRWLQLPAKRLEGRATFNLSASAQNPPRLQLRALEAADEGVYKCRVDYKQSRTDYFHVNLSIIGKYNNAIWLCKSRVAHLVRFNTLSRSHDIFFLPKNVFLFLFAYSSCPHFLRNVVHFQIQF